MRDAEKIFAMLQAMACLPLRWSLDLCTEASVNALAMESMEMKVLVEAFERGCVALACWLDAICLGENAVPTGCRTQAVLEYLEALPMEMVGARRCCRARQVVAKRF